MQSRTSVSTWAQVSFDLHRSTFPIETDQIAGIGTLDEALAWVEYCNSSGNTYFANLRRKHGREKPYNVCIPTSYPLLNSNPLAV